MKIGCCGLDCSKCLAYKATINNDSILRKKVAKNWSDLNKITINENDINCLGCNENGIKTPFCKHLCLIRKCAKSKDFQTCIECSLIKNCEKIKMIISNNKDAVNNLKALKNKNI